MDYKYKVPKTLTTKVKDDDGKTIDKEVETHITGLVEMTVPGHDERIKILKECQYRINPDSKELEKNSDTDFADKINQVVKKYVKSVDVVAHSGDEKFEIKTFEDLGSFNEGNNVISDIFATIAGGIKLGKK